MFILFAQISSGAPYFPDKTRNFAHPYGDLAEKAVKVNPKVLANKLSLTVFKIITLNK